MQEFCNASDCMQSVQNIQGLLGTKDEIMHSAKAKIIKLEQLLSTSFIRNKIFFVQEDQQADKPEESNDQQDTSGHSRSATADYPSPADAESTLLNRGNIHLDLRKTKGK